MTSTKPPERGPGRLSVVATPIGNLEDITLRALRILRECDAVLAEDTRRSRNLLTHHGIARPLRSVHAHTPPEQIDRLVDALREGAHFAIVTDAGTPLVSDPGFALVRAASEAGVRIEAIPGPSAVTTALTMAALPCDTFRFLGFLPRSGKKRKRAIASIGAEPSAVVLFESPNRLSKTLADLAEVLEPTREVAVLREMTKLHEECIRAPIEELVARFEGEVLGEITLVVAGAVDAPEDAAESEELLEEALLRAKAWVRDGLSARDAARRLAEATGIPRREAYRLLLSIE